MWRLDTYMHDEGEKEVKKKRKAMTAARHGGGLLWIKGRA